jgi:hypothetical protein
MDAPSPKTRMVMDVRWSARFMISFEDDAVLLVVVVGAAAAAAELLFKKELLILFYSTDYGVKDGF